MRTSQLLALAICGVTVFAASPAHDLVTTYCVSCHNQKLRSGSLALDGLDAEHISNSPEPWEKVIEAARPCDAAAGRSASG